MRPLTSIPFAVPHDGGAHSAPAREPIGAQGSRQGTKPECGAEPHVSRMRIDAHQHFWCYEPSEYDWIDASMSVLRRDFLPREFEREMQSARVDACIAVQARQSLEETRWLLELADAHPRIAGVVGWVDLRSDDVRTELGRFAAHPKLVGVRHIVQGEPDDRFLLRDDFCRGIAQLEEFGLTYDILIYPRHLSIAAEFVARFERQPFVLDHLAKPEIRAGRILEWERDLRSLAAHPNVWCKLSGLVTEADWSRWTLAEIRPYLDVVFDAFGPTRLMAGSDWPVCTLAGEYGRVNALITDYLEDHPEPVRQAILGGNANRFWRLDARLTAAAEEPLR
jgi:L-fucono-1,5-lactonase